MSSAPDPNWVLNTMRSDPELTKDLFRDPSFRKSMERRVLTAFEQNMLGGTADFLNEIYRRGNKPLDHHIPKDLLLEEISPEEANFIRKQLGSFMTTPSGLGFSDVHEPIEVSLEPIDPETHITLKDPVIRSKIDGRDLNREFYFSKLEKRIKTLANQRGLLMVKNICQSEKENRVLYLKKKLLPLLKKDINPLTP